MHRHGLSLSRSFDVSCKLELRRFCHSPSLSFSSLPHLPLRALPLQPFPVFIHIHTQSHAYRHMRQTASVVSLWCIKTNISSLQINYQLSSWPASVISLSGSRRDGLPLPPSTQGDSYFPLSHGLSTPKTNHHHHYPVALTLR